MAVNIIMPKQGLQMTEGLITAWLASEGDAVTAGEPLFEMETDKLVITIDSPVTGTLLKILAPEGSSVPITETIAIVGEQNDKSMGNAGSWAGGEAGGDVSGKVWSEAGGDVRSEVGGEVMGDAGSEPGGRLNCDANGRRTFITPRAKNLANAAGVDWTKLSGSAPGGMIVERDIMAVKNSAANAKPPVPEQCETNAGQQQYGYTAHTAESQEQHDTVPDQQQVRQHIEPLSEMRRLIAERMKRSLAESAQAVHRISVCMDEAARIRESRNKTIGYNDIIAFATIRALQDCPAMNAEWTDEGVIYKHYVNLGIAVALDNGLIAPVVKDAHLMSLGEVSEAINNLVQKARSNKLTADDCTGGSFTVSNLGMYGLDEFIAILNPPESGILAIGKIGDAPVVIDGRVEIRKMVKLTLTYDHRVIDGAPAALFLSRIKDYLENPYLML